MIKINNNEIASVPNHKDFRSNHILDSKNHLKGFCITALINGNKENLLAFHIKPILNEIASKVKVLKENEVNEKDKFGAKYERVLSKGKEKTEIAKVKITHSNGTTRKVVLVALLSIATAAFAFTPIGLFVFASLILGLSAAAVALIGIVAFAAIRSDSVTTLEIKDMNNNLIKKYKFSNLRVEKRYLTDEIRYREMGYTAFFTDGVKDLTPKYNKWGITKPEELKLEVVDEEEELKLKLVNDLSCSERLKEGIEEN